MAVTAIHPGEHVTEESHELGMSTADLAQTRRTDQSHVNGQRSISADTALRLSHFFGTSAEFWINLQSLYELRLAEKKSGKSIRALPRLKQPQRISA